MGILLSDWAWSLLKLENFPFLGGNGGCEISRKSDVRGIKRLDNLLSEFKGRVEERPRE